MAVIAEKVDSRSFSLGASPSWELAYHITGTEDDTEVRDLILATAPATYEGLNLDTIEAQPLGGGLWSGSAKYAGFAEDEENEYTFDTGGGTEHITQSITTINVYAPPGFTAADYKGAIGVDADRVGGVDIPSPKYEFSETHHLADAVVTQAYKLALFNLTGTVNDDTFRGFAAGECLFLGATGSKRGTGRWAITFRFACQPNATGLSIGDITGIDKFGWDYIWVQHATFEDPLAYMLVQHPISAYVERVFRFADFAGLGIG